MSPRELKTRTYRDFDYEIRKETERGQPVYWTSGSGFETGPHRTLMAADRAARRQINKLVRGGADPMGCTLSALLIGALGTYVLRRASR